MDHFRLFDVAETLMLRPLQHDPKAMEEFRQEVLYAPLTGTVEAKVKAQTKALAQMGLDMESVNAMLAERRRRREEAAAAEAATSV